MANIVTDREQDVELWIRPERVGDGYTVEWTTLDYDQAEREWRPRYDVEATPDDEQGLLHQRAGQLLSSIRAVLTERMPSFDVDREQITVFVIDDTYLFKHYFEQDTVFTELQRYYNEDDYRFEIPTNAFDEVQELLQEHFYDPVVVDEPAQFCVVHPKYADHPDVLFKASVLQRSNENYHVFLMKDQLSVEQAVNNGATQLADTDLEFTV